MEMNCVEKHLQEEMDKNHGRVLTIGRVAHITGNAPHEARGKYQFRNRCSRGCPYGGYFSSNSATLPAAERTGNMTLRPHSIAYEVVYDSSTRKATGVKVIDSETKEKLEFKADFIFCCASAIASASILMQSKSDRFPNGLGNDSGELGHNIMDHHFGMCAGTVDGRLQRMWGPGGSIDPQEICSDQPSHGRSVAPGTGTFSDPPEGRSGKRRSALPTHQPHICRARLRC